MPAKSVLFAHIIVIRCKAQIMDKQNLAGTSTLMAMTCTEIEALTQCTGFVQDIGKIKEYMTFLSREWWK